jgi:hypothetical protein
MRLLFNFIRSIFGFGRKTEKRPNLMKMYFGESNSTGRRKSNRDRA